jgi:hypothetical protein
LLTVRTNGSAKRRTDCRTHRSSCREPVFEDLERLLARLAVRLSLTPYLRTASPSLACGARGAAFTC